MQRFTKEEAQAQLTRRIITERNRIAGLDLGENVYLKELEGISPNHSEPYKPFLSGASLGKYTYTQFGLPGDDDVFSTTTSKTLKG